MVLVKRFSECFGAAKLLMDLALGRVKECPFPNEAVRELKDEVVNVLSSRGLKLKRESGARDELPIDFRFLDFFLRASEDSDTQLGAFAQGVKVGPGKRMPTHSALYRPMRRWRLESQRVPTNWQQEEEKQALEAELRIVGRVGRFRRLRSCLRVRRAEGK